MPKFPLCPVCGLPMRGGLGLDTVYVVERDHAIVREQRHESGDQRLSRTNRKPNGWLPLDPPLPRR